MYGKFFTKTILHKPMCPVSSGTCPSEESFVIVSSSRNITKQALFLEKVPICDNYKLVTFIIADRKTGRGYVTPFSNTFSNHAPILL